MGPTNFNLLDGEALDKKFSEEEIDKAVVCLLSGNLIVFPTETVYGLGADAEQVKAVEKIYKLKQRPINHPVIVHISPEKNLSYWADLVPQEAFRLADVFWPGPLTLILKRAKHINNTITGGQESIGIRCPSHPIAQEILRNFSSKKRNGQAGIAAPSANKFGKISPTRLDHVYSEFPCEIKSGMPILDGGDTRFGIESTIIDLSRLQENYPPILLRPGCITVDELENVLGRKVRNITNDQVVRSPGSHEYHYRPNTDLELISTSQLNFLVKNKKKMFFNSQKIAIVAYINKPHFIDSQFFWYSLPNNSFHYGRKLYDLLHKLDKQGFYKIMLQIPPRSRSWEAVNDRLNRAGNHSFFLKKKN